MTQNEQNSRELLNNNQNPAGVNQTKKKITGSYTEVNTKFYRDYNHFLQDGNAFKEYMSRKFLFPFLLHMRNKQNLKALFRPQNPILSKNWHV